MIDDWPVINARLNMYSNKLNQLKLRIKVLKIINQWFDSKSCQYGKCFELVELAM